MSMTIPLRRTVRNVTHKSENAGFRIALEDIAGWTGELRVTETEYEGVGIAFERGDVLLGKLRPNLAKVWLADRPGSAVGDFLVLRPEGNLTGRALRDFLLQRSTIDYLASTAYGSKMPRTSWEFVGSLPLPVIEPGRQRAIADFLDRETAEIDEFVAESEKLITLLNERRAAVITQAVTKGLDPTVPMKDTGIEWLGQIPAHWSAPEIRRFYSLQIGKMLNESKFSGNPAPYVRAGNIQDHGLDLAEVKMMPVTESEKASLAIRAGDVLFVEGGAGYGRSDYVDEDLGGWVFQNHVIRIRPLAGAPVSGKYLDFWLRFLRAQGHYEALSAFATIPNVSADKLGQIEMTLPPLGEQVEIVAQVSEQTAKIGKAIQIAREAIALAKERRQALISAAVTGKIDVRSAA